MRFIVNTQQEVIVIGRANLCYFNFFGSYELHLGSSDVPRQQSYKPSYILQFQSSTSTVSSVY